MKAVTMVLANDTLLHNGGRHIVLAPGVVRAVGAREDVLRVRDAADASARYEVIRCGENQLGTYSVDLRVFAGVSA